MDLPGDQQARKTDPDLPSGLRLRAADPSDVEAIIAADIAASALFAPTGLLSTDALADHVEADDILNSIEDQLIHVADWESEGVVGFIQYRPIESDLYLSQLSVDPAFGQRGIGRALLAYLDQRAADLGPNRIVLSTFRDLAWNGPFYASAGFIEIPRDQFEPYMIEIERSQAPFMDVSKRIFMSKTLRHSRKRHK